MAALEPVIATLIANTAEFTASLDEAKAQMAEFGAAADTSGAEGDLANLGAAGTLAGEDVADGATVAAAGLNDAKTAAEDAKGGMTDLADGAGLAGAGLRDTHDAAEDAEGGMRDTESAAKDLGTAAEDSGGKFSGLSNILGSMGVPLGAAGSKAEQAGSSMDRAGNEAGIFSGKIAGIPIPVVAAGAALVGLSAVAVHMATSFQTSMTQLVTGAGESQKNIGLVSTGILNMAGQVGTSASDLASGMYLIESAGDHGAAGLQVLQAAAEGAKVGNANLADVANVVTSALNAYGLKAKDATSVTNQLVATVAAGKMHMQDLTTSIAAVLPVAASSKIAFSQIGGALATMTAQGMTARRASMGLANMIRALIAPSAQSSAEMKTLGLNANEVATNIGKAGLTGTLDQLTTSVLKSTQGGAVMATGFQNMSPAAKALSEQILAGTITTKNLTTAMQALSPTQAKLVSNFESSATSATGLKQTFDSAMKTMVGGATGLNVALLLTGTHAKTFADNVKSVADAAKQSGGAVEGFSKIQGDLAFQLDAAKDAVQAFLIKIGLQLIPVVTDLMSVVAQAIPILEDAFSIAFDIVKTAVVGVVTAITTVVKSVVDVITWFKAASIPALALGAALTTILLPAFIALGAQAVAAMVRMAVSAATTFGQMIAAGATWIAEQATQIAVSVANMGLFIARSAVMAAAWVADTLGMEGASAALTGALESLQPIAAQTATAIEETGAAAETAGTETSSSMETAAAAMETAATSMQAAATSMTEALSTIGSGAATMSTEIDAATANADVAMTTMAADARVAAAEVDASMGSIDTAEIAGVGTAAATAGEGLGAEGLAGGAVASEGAATGLVGALTPLVAVLAPVAMGIYAATHANDGFKVSLQGSAAAAMDMTANTLPQMAVKIDDLRQSQEQASEKIKEGGLAAQVAQSAYNTLGNEIDTLRNQQTNLSNNLTILSGNFGVSKSQADSLAEAAGINLNKALDPADVSAFAQEIQLSGANMDTAGQKAQNMGSTTVAAISAMAAQMKATLTGSNWTSIGTSIDQGIAGGIAGGSGLMQAAMAGVAGQTLLAGKQAIGAHSPSTLAAQVIGLPIAQGVAIGIQQGATIATAAAQQMATNTTTAAGDAAIVAAKVAQAAIGQMTAADWTALSQAGTEGGTAYLKALAGGITAGAPTVTAAATGATSAMTTADWAALAKAGAEGGTAYLEALATTVQSGTSTSLTDATSSSGMTTADWAALAQAGAEGGTAYLEALNAQAHPVAGVTGYNVGIGGVNVSNDTASQIQQVLSAAPQPAPAVPSAAQALASTTNPGGPIAGFLSGTTAPIAAVNPGGPMTTTTTVVSQPINVQVNGQTLASTVATVLLKQARSTGNVLGQYAGGTQSQSATIINTNAVPR